MLVYLAIEDELSQQVGRKLISNIAPTASIHPIGFRGNSYLRTKIREFSAIARTSVVIIFTDLDAHTCPVEMRTEWLGTVELPEKLVFRIAEKEIESWLLADHDGLKEFMGERINKHLPREPDIVANPKEHMLKVANLANRDVRSDLVTTTKNGYQRGLGYNERLSSFVNSIWSIENAAQRSQSLQRAQRHIHRILSQ